MRERDRLGERGGGWEREGEVGREGEGERGREREGGKERVGEYSMDTKIHCTVHGSLKPFISSDNIHYKQLTMCLNSSAIELHQKRQLITTKVNTTN